jgi:hypothetical protein
MDYDVVGYVDGRSLADRYPSRVHSGYVRDDVVSDENVLRAGNRDAGSGTSRVVISNIIRICDAAASDGGTACRCAEKAIPLHLGALRDSVVLEAPYSNVSDLRVAIVATVHAGIPWPQNAPEWVSEIVHNAVRRLDLDRRTAAAGGSDTFDPFAIEVQIGTCGKCDALAIRTLDARFEHTVDIARARARVARP